MKIAPPTHDESARLALLRALDVLDTEPEEVFDALTQLVAELLDVPIALVSLVDEHRQWFKSHWGLDARETPREMAFCAHAIHGNEPFVVSDSEADPRFFDNPLVTGAPHVRFYAGVPLRTADGHALGTLCAIDHVPRQLDPRQLKTLEKLAAVARRELLNREAAMRARQLAAENLRVVSESEALYHATFDRAAVGMAVVGLDGRWIRFNPELCSILARPADELAALTFQDVTYAPDLDMDLGYVRQLLDGEAEHYTLEKRYVRPDGSLIWGHLTVTLVRVDGQPSHFVAVIADITARRAAEASLHELRLQLEQRVRDRTAELHRANESLCQTMQLRHQSQAALERSEGQLRAVIENALDAFVSVDGAGIVHEWNRQAEHIFGWTRAEAIGRRMAEMIVPLAHRAAHEAGMERMIRTGQSRVLGQRLEVAALRRDGTAFPCEVTLTALPAAPGEQHLFAAFMHDITRRKEYEQRLADAATIDALTGLPNRRSFEEQAHAALARARRETRCVSVFFLDLDKFKSINDEHGHAGGDTVLKAFASRLRGVMRETDIVARLAGDEFVIMLEGIESLRRDELEQVARKIISAVSQPLELSTGPVPLKTSIGVTVGDGHSSLEHLLHDADQALYRAKTMGRNTVCLSELARAS